MTTNYPITASGSIDMLGDEFPSLYCAPKFVASPLAADFPDADTSNWSSDARPPVTAWEGADMDAHWLDNGTWRHCRTGEAWEGEPVNLLAAVRALRSEPAGANISLATATAFMCAVLTNSYADSLRAASGEEQSTSVAAE